jgi:hypothetical protein
MLDYIELPPGFDPQPHIERAFAEIKNYTAIFILEDGRVGSGIFVNACGFEGILTAYHVAMPALESKVFALCIAEHEHGVWLRSENFEHVPVGRMRDNPAERGNGPDLSFIIIRDGNLLGILRSLKSFCFLDTQKLAFFEAPLERQVWAIAGSPYEWKAIVKPATASDGPLTKLSNWVGLGHCQSRAMREGFDYIEIEIWAGLRDYPLNYRGVSGGGFWLIPLEVDHDGDMKSLSHAKPALAGVAFYQTDPPVDNRRVITGHGFDSIYCRVRQTLTERAKQ